MLFTQLNLFPFSRSGKMLLVLGEEQKQDLSLLSQVEEEIAVEFCRIAVEFIKQGINTKKYQSASQKLNIDVHLIRKSVEALMNLLTESCKLSLSELDFQDSIISIGLSETLNQRLLDFHTEHCKEIRNILGRMTMTVPHYKDLEWRFDVKIASRMLQHQTTPEILLRLGINSGNDVETHLLQTDPVNLVHMTHVLEEALAELKSGHCRRIGRNIR